MVSNNETNSIFLVLRICLSFIKSVNLFNEQAFNFCAKIITSFSYNANDLVKPFDLILPMVLGEHFDSFYEKDNFFILHGKISCSQKKYSTLFLTRQQIFWKNPVLLFWNWLQFVIHHFYFEKEIKNIFWTLFPL